MGIKLNQMASKVIFYAKQSVIFSMLAWVVACESSKIKEVAIETAKKQFGVQIRAEMDQSGVAAHELAEQYFIYILKNTDFEVMDIDKRNPNSAIVKINVESIPKEFRSDLSNIVVKLKGISTTRFNMGEAILLIRRQHQAKFDTQLIQRYIQVNKKQNQWVGE